MAGYVPLDGRPMRFQVGTRPLDPNDWIEIDDRRAADLQAKDELLRAQRDDVMAELPEGRAGAREVGALLLDFLPRRYPQTFVATDGGVRDLELDREIRMTDELPLEATARLVQEDICVMSRDGEGRWRLTAAAVCFPSHWSMREKLGQDMDGIHEPVPDYEGRLARPTQSILDRLSPHRPVWRLNWTIVGRPDLHLLYSRDSWPGLDRGEDPGDALFFRVERQTLRALPVSGDIVFTIRTYVTSLRDMGRIRPGIYADLLAGVSEVGPELIAYRGWADVVEPMRAWLEAQVRIESP